MASKDTTNGSAARDENQRMTALLVKALNHPLRRKLLRELHRCGEARSPVQLSKTIDADVTNIDYHVKILASLGAAEKTGDRPVRGASENFFASTVADHRQMTAILADTERDDDGAHG